MNIARYASNWFGKSVNVFHHYCSGERSVDKQRVQLFHSSTEKLFNGVLQMQFDGATPSLAIFPWVQLCEALRIGKFLAAHLKQNIQPCYEALADLLTFDVTEARLLVWFRGVTPAKPANVDRRNYEICKHCNHGKLLHRKRWNFPASCSFKFHCGTSFSAGIGIKSFSSTDEKVFRQSLFAVQNMEAFETRRTERCYAFHKGSPRRKLSDALSTTRSCFFMSRASFLVFHRCEKHNFWFQHFFARQHNDIKLWIVLPYQRTLSVVSLKRLGML